MRYQHLHVAQGGTAVSRCSRALLCLADGNGVLHWGSCCMNRAYLPAHPALLKAGRRTPPAAGRTAVERQGGCRPALSQLPPRQLQRAGRPPKHRTQPTIPAAAEAETRIRRKGTVMSITLRQTLPFQGQKQRPTHKWCVAAALLQSCVQPRQPKQQLRMQRSLTRQCRGQAGGASVADGCWRRCCR